MISLNFSINGIVITPFWWMIVLGALTAAFSFWRLMREDYHQEIYPLTLWLGLFSVVFAWLGRIWGLSLFFSLTGTVLVLIFWLKIQKKDFWEAFDFFLPSVFYLLIFGGVGQFLSVWRPIYLNYCVVGLLGFFLYIVLKKKYRSFAWYQSGKVGFLAWATLAFLSLAFLSLAFWKNKTLYYESCLWLVLFVICLVVIYFRSGRNLKQDFKVIFKKR